ncbi:AMP-binding protein [Skermania sp. ID1734]|uniref:long-chain-fatty-acid--CoA ligase n=1 Tax=Skermania sp. ID1734 TaxID=2597516 RepID=UPI00117E547A|nr:long-chain-fatty-acid--CoA ligase [Skermania sp. ID1734]TSD96502.1 AMP-binding protein [Skermania sp. ID1734]
MTETVAALLTRLRTDTVHGLHFEDEKYSWASHYEQSARRVAVLGELLAPDRPPHFGVLLDNVPEFSFLLGAAALSGSVLVGLNSTRRGSALARDICLSDCQVVLTEQRHRELLNGLDLDGIQIIEVDGPDWSEVVERNRDADPAPIVATPDDLLMLVFTSGTSGEPKAVRCTHRKVCWPGIMLTDRFGLTEHDTVYVSMPMFHSNAIMAGWSVALAAGSNLVLRRRFSASQFFDDVRRYGVTYANYVGKPLAYILQTPPRPDDADNPLRLMYGNEGSTRLVREFARRFDVTVLDAFGSSEGGIAISPDPAAPPGALGRLPEGIAVVSPDTDEPCPPARFDAAGNLLNADEAIGELVNMAGPGAFAGYYNDPAATAERMRGGKYRSGDLAYCDAAGYVYFAGRTSGWMRVDGENIAVAPIERILLRHPAISVATVYGIPDSDGGDKVMAAVMADRHIDADELVEFLAGQTDLGPKQVPSYVRVCRDLPRTASFKTLTRMLQAEGLNCDDQVLCVNFHRAR